MQFESVAPLGTSGRSVSRELMVAIAKMAGVGLVAIGVSGILAAVMGASFGKGFVSGSADGITYTPQRCADFLSFFPDAGTCEAAATAHHFDEAVSYRAAAGVLGLVTLGAWWFMRRRFARPVRPVLPPSTEPAVGAALFGVAAVALLGLGTTHMTFGGSSNGAGEFLSDGIVALAAFGAYALRLRRAITDEPDASPHR